MRPVEDDGKLRSVHRRGRQLGKIFVTALDGQDEFLNFELTAACWPRLDPRDRLEQISPGRYVGDFEAEETGRYFAMLSPGPGLSPVARGSTSPTRPSSASAKANVALLESMAELRPLAVVQAW